MLKKIDPNIPYYWIKLDTGEATVRGANELDDPAAADQRFLVGNYFDDRAMAEWYAEMINLTLQARNYDSDIDDEPDYNTSNVKRVPKGQRYFYLAADDNADLSPVECVEPITVADRHAATGNYFASEAKAQAAVNTLNELRRKLSAEIE